MRDRRLEVEIVDGELRICIGVDTLTFAAHHSPDNRLSWAEDGEIWRYDILDIDEFAKDVRLALLDEDHDGTTPVHTLLDDAMIKAIEEGSLAVAEDPVKQDW